MTKRQMKGLVEFIKEAENSAHTRIKNLFTDSEKLESAPFNDFVKFVLTLKESDRASKNGSVFVSENGKQFFIYVKSSKRSCVVEFELENPYDTIYIFNEIAKARHFVTLDPDGKFTTYTKQSECKQLNCNKDFDVIKSTLDKIIEDFKS